MGPVRALLARRRRFLARYLRVMVSLARQRDLAYTPERMQRPEGERPLVLSPHCDDEVIGLGGLMHGLAREGRRVTVVYFTRPATRAKGGRAGAAEVRKREARHALAALGDTFDLLFLDRPEGRLQPDRTLLARFVALLQDVRPDVVFLPWFLDDHVDHLAVNAILERSASRYRPPCVVYAYEVWTPLLPNRLFEITEFASIKEEALSRYASQLAEVNLVRTTLALNRYRSALLGKGEGHFEAFLRMGLAEYVRLVAASRAPWVAGLRGGAEWTL